ncbi:mechanosensitive ion channel family protein [Candidatus Micrarchaeota archaeon]|nr:mechanosensitive ion channel family protein [Candidatus Micrarchaeota archaeon]MBU1939415.1 mechanosensitive ion channel family protein [Candidatus Micrarchaeota archaeon]
MALEILGLSGLIELGNGQLGLLVDISIILAATVILAKIFDMIILGPFRQMSRNLKVDETRFLIVRRLITLLIYVFGIVIAATMVPGFSSIGVSLLASAGVLAVVLGLAAQQTFSNIIAGIFIGIYKPFRVGDKLKINEEYGEVEDITLRHTVINTWQNIRLIIPNSKISEQAILNYSIMDPKILSKPEIGISYDSDIDLARKIMTEEANKHPGVLKDVRKGNEYIGKDEVVRVRLISLGDFSQTLRLLYWAKDRPTSINTDFELLEAIKKRFDKEGVEIPYPYRTIVYKKDMKPNKQDPPGRQEKLGK